MKRKRYFIVSTLVIGMIILTGCGTGAKDRFNQEETSNESITLKSELENVEECYLCGESDASMMSYYRQYDSIGLIALNEWSVLDFRLTEESDSSSMVQGNSETFSYKVDALPSRGMSHVTVSSKKEFDSREIQEHLCQGCLEKVWENSQGEEISLPFCIVDYQTLEIYPVQRMDHSYFVRDYWVEVEYDDEEIVDMKVYYLPKIIFNNSDKWEILLHI